MSDMEIIFLNLMFILEFHFYIYCQIMFYVCTMIVLNIYIE